MTKSPKGYVTKFGYRRIKCKDRKLRFEHVLVWESHFGPVPAGKELHHINGNKLDNRIENLQALSRIEHKRIHSGCELRDGVWWKRCRVCEEFLPATAFYYYPGGKGLVGTCKSCHSKLAVEYKHRRRQRQQNAA